AVGIAGAADGLIVAECEVAGGQALPTKSTHAHDRSAGAYAHQRAAAARVVVASEGQVIVEGAVRERGHGDVGEPPANGDADPAISARAADGVGTADGLVRRERTAAQIERPKVHDATGTAEVNGVTARAGTPAAPIAPHI